MSCATCGCVGPWDYCPVSDENYWLATAVHKWNQQAALNELATLRQERDALKARVEELEGENRQLAFDDYKIHGKDTTPGGDE